MFGACFFAIKGKWQCHYVEKDFEVWPIAKSAIAGVWLNCRKQPPIGPCNRPHTYL